MSQHNISHVDLTDDSSNQSHASESNATASVEDAEPMQAKIEKAMKRLTANQNMKFMENFDPHKSNRERRKLDRKTQPSEQEGAARRHRGGKPSAHHDEKGILKASGKDLCDCLDESCPGCHFPCPKCRSCKCGPDCRQNRKYCVESYGIEGSQKFVYNKFK